MTRSASALPPCRWPFLVGTPLQFICVFLPCWPLANSGRGGLQRVLNLSPGQTSCEAPATCWPQSAGMWWAWFPRHTWHLSRTSESNRECSTPRVDCDFFHFCGLSLHIPKEFGSGTTSGEFVVMLRSPELETCASGRCLPPGSLDFCRTEPLAQNRFGEMIRLRDNPNQK